MDDAFHSWDGQVEVGARSADIYSKSTATQPPWLRPHFSVSGRSDHSGSRKICPDSIDVGSYGLGRNKDFGFKTLRIKDQGFKGFCSHRQRTAGSCSCLSPSLVVHEAWEEVWPPVASKASMWSRNHKRLKALDWNLSDT